MPRLNDFIAPMRDVTTNVLRRVLSRDTSVLIRAKNLLLALIVTIVRLESHIFGATNGVTTTRYEETVIPLASRKHKNSKEYPILL